MNKILEKINSAKHIVIFSDVAHLPVASALYSHLLRLDKKLSFVLKTSSIPLELSFLPWYDKIKTSKITSYDFLIEVDFNSFEFFEYLKDSNNKINKKIATSLYAGILKESDGFLKNISNGTIFAISKELIECGANYKICNEFIRQRTTLASLRLKSIMFKEMILINSAKKAVFYINDDDLISCGATLEDCYEIIKEALNLPFVKEAMLLDKDKNDKIIKIIT